MIRAKRIIADSIKDHLIPQVSSKNTPKDMFDALTRMYEGKKIHRKMYLRTQLKNTKMQKGETVQDYFSRVSQFKEQLEAIGDNLDEDELLMVSQDLVMPSSKLSVQEKRNSNLTVYGKNVFKKKQEWPTEKSYY
jgi:phosphopentomutase